MKPFQTTIAALTISFLPAVAAAQCVDGVCRCASVNNKTQSLSLDVSIIGLVFARIVTCPGEWTHRSEPSR